ELPARAARGVRQGRGHAPRAARPGAAGRGTRRGRAPARGDVKVAAPCPSSLFPLAPAAATRAAMADRSSLARRAFVVLGPWLGLLAAWLLFAATAGATFVALDNQRLMLLQTAVVGVAAVGATLVIASGGIDLSVGSSIALATVVLGLVLRAGGSPAAAAGLAVATSGACGLLVGAFVTGRIVLAVGLAGAALAATLTAPAFGGGA